VTVGRRLVFHPGFRVRVEEHVPPEPGPGDVLVRVGLSHVSAGSELNGLRRLDGEGGEPRPGGYTAVGRVERLGPGVAGFRVGDRVLTKGYHGSHWLADSRDRGVWGNAPVPLPDDVSDEQACFSALALTAIHGVRRGALQIDESVAVLGVGAVGQLAVQLCRLSGAHPIVAVDLDPTRLGLARLSGATHAVDASRTDLVAGVREATGGAGAETVFHCSANPALLQPAMSAASDRGTVVLIGSAPGTAEIGLQVELLRRELTILGCYETGVSPTPHAYWPWTQERDRRAWHRLVASGQVRTDHLISHRLRPEDAEGIFRAMAAGPGGWMGVLFDWSG
jgi:L-iditol 2-dehydrogenase